MVSNATVSEPGINGDENVVRNNDDQPGPSTAVKKLYGVPSDRGGTRWLEQCPDYIKRPVYDADHALLARYKEARSGPATRPLTLTSIHIQSPFLKNIIRQVFRTYPSQAVDEEDPSFEAPFYQYFHRWATLRSVCGAAGSGDVRSAEQADALMQVLEEELGQDMRDAQNLARNGNITFRLLWTLFPPGCPVFSDWKDQKHCFLVNEARFLSSEIQPMLALELILLDHDGLRYGWRKISKAIPAFSGITRITELSTVPLHFHVDSRKSLDELAARGRIAAELLRKVPVYKAYDGPIRLHRSFDLEEVEISVEGRIIVDSKTHSQQASRYAPSVFTIPHKLECFLTRDANTKLVTLNGQQSRLRGLLSPADNLNSHPVLSVGQNRLVLNTSSQKADVSTLSYHRWIQDLFGIPAEAFCRSVVRGYCLTSKAWAEFEVKNVAEIRWNHDAFDALVMSAVRKRLLEALVRQQQSHKTDVDVDDVVQGKGQGLIMLLSGPPGTGKTLTAESIADRLKLPLYAVNAGELGDTAKDIENYFGQVLRLAASWNAVLLLDEADAFLDRRVDSPEARERNKRVAAFLRILEYYKGILILTTNRLVNFDDAFYSRIHLNLPFKALSRDSREKIWVNFLRGADVNSADVSVFAGEDLNGRQIKNVMKMSRLLAKDLGVELSAQHIHDVLDVVRQDSDNISGTISAQPRSLRET